MFLAKPSFFPRFAINDVTDGGGRVNVTEPPTDKKNAGWEYLEKPARDYMNWIHRGNYLWIDYFNQFWNSSHQFVINEMISESGNGIDILQPLGIKTVPVSGTNLQIHQADSAASIQRFTNSTTGTTATDGFEIGLDASEQGRIWNYENTDLIIGTNNTEMLLIDNAGNIGVRNGIPLYIYSAGNDKYLSLIHNDTNALISTNSGNIYTDKLFGIGVAPSNPLHVQSTTTPQVRIAYDADSYATINLDSGSNLTIKCAESGIINIPEFIYIGGINSQSRPTTSYIVGTAFSWNYSGGVGENDIWNTYPSAGTSFSFKQMTGVSAHTDLLNISPTGTLYVLGTTECTGADTGALQVSGGAYIAGNLVCLGGGDIATNCAMGRALVANTTGYSNTAMGHYALLANTTGFSNTAIGHAALVANTTGYINTAIGHAALAANTTGYINTAMGQNALAANTTGYSNTAIGFSAGSDLTTGHNVTCIGYNAQSSAADVTNQVTLGDTSVGSLRCQVALTVLSDERDKTNIKPLSVGLDFINGLNPVSYNRDNRDWYKDKKKDGSKALKEKNIGLLAQEVMALEDKFDKTLGIVNREVAEKLEMTYEKFIPIIIKAIQELSKKIDTLG